MKTGLQMDRRAYFDARRRKVLDMRDLAPVIEAFRRESRRVIDGDDSCKESTLGLRFRDAPDHQALVGIRRGNRGFMQPTGAHFDLCGEFWYIDAHLARRFNIPVDREVGVLGEFKVEVTKCRGCFTDMQIEAIANGSMDLVISFGGVAERAEWAEDILGIDVPTGRTKCPIITFADLTDEEVAALSAVTGGINTEEDTSALAGFVEFVAKRNAVKLLQCKDWVNQETGEVYKTAREVANAMLIRMIEHALIPCTPNACRTVISCAMHLASSDPVAAMAPTGNLFDNLSETMEEWGKRWAERIHSTMDVTSHIDGLDDSLLFNECRQMSHRHVFMSKRAVESFEEERACGYGDVVRILNNPPRAVFHPVVGKHLRRLRLLDNSKDGGDPLEFSMSPMKGVLSANLWVSGTLRSLNKHNGAGLAVVTRRVVDRLFDNGEAKERRRSTVSSAAMNKMSRTLQGKHAMSRTLQGKHAATATAYGLFDN